MKKVLPESKSNTFFLNVLRVTTQASMYISNKQFVIEVNRLTPFDG